VQRGGYSDLAPKEFFQKPAWVLEGSGIVERKAFLKSLMDRIEVDKVETPIVYAPPILPDTTNGGREAVGVLPFGNGGPPFWIIR
jgi:hypothetical protein